MGWRNCVQNKKVNNIYQYSCNSPFINPTFQIGRIIQGGDGAPQFRWMYNDNVVGETVVMELDSEGIMSSVPSRKRFTF
jgi:hypothetical protein